MRFDANRMGITDYMDRGLTWLKALHELESEIARPRDSAVAERIFHDNIKKLNDLLETGFKGDKSHDITRREECIPAIRLLEDLWMGNVEVFKDTEYFNACMTAVTPLIVSYNGSLGEVYDQPRDAYIIDGDGSHNAAFTYQCGGCGRRFFMLGEPGYCPRCGLRVKDCVDVQDLLREKLMSRLFDYSPSLAVLLRDAINGLDRKEDSNARASHGEDSVYTCDVPDDDGLFDDMLDFLMGSSKDGR